MQTATAPVETTVLQVPALPRYARLVRMTAANMAQIAGMNIEDVDDVRMAAEEAFVYACATGVQGALRVSFALTSDALRMDFELGAAAVAEDEEEPSLVYGAFILEAMCDECAIVDGPVNVLRLVKRVGEGDGY
jgi:serine/threonine-protein kinase RsbW